MIRVNRASLRHLHMGDRPRRGIDLAGGHTIISHCFAFAMNQERDGIKKRKRRVGYRSARFSRSFACRRTRGEQRARFASSLRILSRSNLLFASLLCGYCKTLIAHTYMYKQKSIVQKRAASLLYICQLSQFLYLD